MCNLRLFWLCVYQFWTLIKNYSIIFLLKFNKSEKTKPKTIYNSILGDKIILCHPENSKSQGLRKCIS